MLIFIWVVSMVLSTMIGASKGSAIGGLLLGLFLGPVGALASLALQDNNRKECPFCKELIKRAAVKCPKCQSDLSTPPAA